MTKIEEEIVSDAEVDAFYEWRFTFETSTPAMGQKEATKKALAHLFKARRTQTRRVRYVMARGSKLSEMASALEETPLYSVGAALLVWANEGDLCASGQLYADATLIESEIEK